MNSYKLDGVAFRPVCFTPTFSKFQGELCSGVQLHVTNKKAFSPFAAGVRLVETLRDMYDIEFNEKAVRRIFGTERLIKGVSADTLINDSIRTSEAFKKRSSSFYLY